MPRSLGMLFLRLVSSLPHAVTAAGSLSFSLGPDLTSRIRPPDFACTRLRYSRARAVRRTLQVGAQHSALPADVVSVSVSFTSVQDHPPAIRLGVFPQVTDGRVPQRIDTSSVGKRVGGNPREFESRILRHADLQEHPG